MESEEQEEYQKNRWKGQFQTNKALFLTQPFELWEEAAVEAQMMQRSAGASPCAGRLFGTTSTNFSYEHSYMPWEIIHMKKTLRTITNARKLNRN